MVGRAAVIRCKSQEEEREGSVSVGLLDVQPLIGSFLRRAYASDHSIFAPLPPSLSLELIEAD